MSIYYFLVNSQYPIHLFFQDNLVIMAGREKKIEKWEDTVFSMNDDFLTPLGIKKMTSNNSPKITIIMYIIILVQHLSRLLLKAQA
jgi:hypothetical protein